MKIPKNNIRGEGGGMFLHLGGDKALRARDIVGIFDIDRTTVSPVTKKFLSDAEKKGKLQSVTNDVPRSFTVTAEGSVYISQISPQSLLSRSENM